MEVKKGDTVSINSIEATVTEVLDSKETKRHKCWILQLGKPYLVNISDIKLIRSK